MAGILLNRSRQVPAEDTPAFGGIAERFRRGGDLDRAIALCREGLKKFPDQLSARVTLGWSLLDKGEYDEARAELERVIRRAPDNLAAIRGLAELHDRSEGALTSMDGRDLDAESIAAAVAAEPTAPSAHVAAAPTAATAPPPAPPQDRFAPIAVTLASARAEPSPEVLHTADDAGRAAREAALAAAALLGVEPEPVEVEGPAAAAMAASAAPTSLLVTAAEPAGLDVDELTVAAASFALDTQFDAGPATFDATPPVLANPADLAVERANELDGAVDLIVEAGVTVETPAEWALSDASPAESFSVSSFAPADVAAEADELVAALQASDVHETPDAQALMLEVPATGDDTVSLDVALTSLESALALEGDTAVFETLETETDEAVIRVDASSELAGTPEPAAPAASEFVASEVAELTELLSADHVDQDVPSVQPAVLETALDETVERPEAAVAFEAINEPVEPAIVASVAQVATDTSAPVMVVPVDEVTPLGDTRDGVPEPAFAPDLTPALESHGPSDAADRLAGLPTLVALAGEAPAAPAVEAVIEPEFLPDLSSVTLEDAPFELQALTLEEVELRADEAAVVEVLDPRDLQPDPSANLAFHFEDRVREVAVEPVVVDEARSPVEITEVLEAQDVAVVAAASVAEESVAEEVEAVFAPIPAAEMRPGPQAETGPGIDAEPEPIVSPFAALAALSSMPHSVIAIGPAAERSAAVVMALERFLRQVQARRLQLSAESVA